MHITLCPSKEPQGPIPLIHHVHLHRLLFLLLIAPPQHLLRPHHTLPLRPYPSTRRHKRSLMRKQLLHIPIPPNPNHIHPIRKHHPLRRLKPMPPRHLHPRAPLRPNPNPPPLPPDPLPPPPPPRSAPRPTTRSTSSWPPARPLSHTPASALRTSRRSTAAPWARPPRRAGTRR